MNSQKLTKSVLINTLKERGITHVEVDGKKLSLGRAKIGALRELLGKFEDEDISTPDITEPEKDLPEGEVQVNEVKNYIRGCINELVEASLKDDIDRMLDLSMNASTGIISRILDISDSENPHTISNNRSRIFSSLEKEYLSMESKYKNEYLSRFKKIKNNIYNSEELVKHRQLKRKKSQENITERKEKKTKINPTKMIDWAIGVLENLDKYDSYYWKPVTQAIKVLSGRRTSEILSSAKFVESKYAGCLWFSGQNKKHKKDLGLEKEKPFIIPIIGGKTDLVIAGIDWLNTSGKRIKPKDDSWRAQLEANTLVNKRYGRYISDFCKGRDGFHLNFYDLIEAEKDWHEQMKPDCTRDIYCQVVGVSKAEECSDLSEVMDYLIHCLGHSGDKAFINYNVDFKCDYSRIKKYMKNVDTSFFKYGKQQ